MKFIIVFLVIVIFLNKIKREGFMTPVSFVTPVHYGPAAESWGHTLVEKVDDYFFLGGRKAVVLTCFPEVNNSRPTLFDILPSLKKGDSYGV